MDLSLKMTVSELSLPFKQNLKKVSILFVAFDPTRARDCGDC